MIKFVGSFETVKSLPNTHFAEYAFIGRSNVWKSSLINAVVGAPVARTSNTPGRTQSLNLFNLDDRVMIVDLPGYGYAKVSKKEQESWGKTIETYLTAREELKRVILLVDSRHKPTADDITMHEWIKHYGYDVIVVATKSDKLSNNALAKSKKIIKETLNLTENDTLCFFSSLNKKGAEQLNDILFGDLAE